MANSHNRDALVDYFQERRLLRLIPTKKGQVSEKPVSLTSGLLPDGRHSEVAGSFITGLLSSGEGASNKRKPRLRVAKCHFGGVTSIKLDILLEVELWVRLLTIHVLHGAPLPDG